jgi:hypothetical protein
MERKNNNRYREKENDNKFQSDGPILCTFKNVSINLFHLCTEAAEDNLLNNLRREFANSFHGNFGCSLPRVAIDAGRNSGEGNSLTIILFGKIKTAFIARFQKFRFTMLTVTINRSRGMNHKLCRELKPGSDFGLTRLTTFQGNTCLQKFRTVFTAISVADSQGYP